MSKEQYQSLLLVRRLNLYLIENAFLARNELAGCPSAVLTPKICEEAEGGDRAFFLFSLLLLVATQGALQACADDVYGDGCSLCRCALKQLLEPVAKLIGAKVRELTDLKVYLHHPPGMGLGCFGQGQVRDFT